MIYIVIMLAKVIEVTLATVRIVLITKGERKVGSIIAFFEVVLWLLLMNSVLQDIMADPMRIVGYSLGFSIGNYLGSLLEERIGIGLSEMQVIVDAAEGDQLAHIIREKGYGVTTVDAEGRISKRKILIMYLPRNKVKSITKDIHEVAGTSVITVAEKKAISGGFGMIKK